MRYQGCVSNSSQRYGDGAVAIVTGAASGIGRSIAEALAAQGADVVLADLQADLAEEVAAGIRQQGGKATSAALDVRDADAVEALVAATFERTNRLDLIFNNAGIAVVGKAEDHEVADWKKIVDVNVLGVAHGVSAAYPRMLEQGFGHIVNTASMAGLIPTPSLIAYGTTKHAVVGMSRSLRAEAASRGVRVSAVCPGVIRTPIFDGGVHGRLITDVPREEILETIEKTRPMPAEELAKRVIRRIERNHAIIIEPRAYRVAFALDRFSRPLSDWLWRTLGDINRKNLDRPGAAAPEDTTR